ncbi:hypothetical protein [Pseudoxanthomonas mexicana]
MESCLKCQSKHGAMRWMRFLILLLAAALSGCAAFVWPHRTQRTPEVAGVVLSDGLPVAGAVVHFHHALTAQGCGSSKLTATTDSHGRFSFDGRKAFELFAVIGDRPNRWALCIESDDQFIEGWRAFGMGYPPERISFVCDLRETPQVASRGRGVCRPDA